MTTERDAFAKRLNKLLAEKKLPASPAELAALLARHGASVTPQTISGWLNGTFMPRSANQRALARLLDIGLSTLLEDDTTSIPRGVKESPAHWPSGVDGKDALALREFAALPAAHRKLVRDLISALATVSGGRDRK